MHLSSLTARNLRILASVDLSIDADLVVFSGPNGSGKSSLLEAIHILGTGRSFRARSVQDVISRGQDTLLVRAEFSKPTGGRGALAIEKPRQGSARFRLDGEAVGTASELARQLPLVFVSADSQRLLSDGAEMRRRQLDWLMFHVEPNYQELFARYRRALGQRNALLRLNSAGNRDEQLAWAQEMAVAGEQLHALRHQRLLVAEPILQAALKDLGSIDLEFVYKAGWDTEKSLADVLHSSWDADRSRGYSGYGPHRADLQFMVGGRPTQHVVSRGEGKVLVFAVLVAFARVLASSVQVRPLMLVDELASELDGENRERFLTALRDLEMQTFITTVSQDLVNPSGWGRVCMCSLSQGEVVQVLQ